MPANGNPLCHDCGLCGPIRKDLAQQTQYCGMFLTPTLRNVDRRSVFFHNGVYTTLKQVLDFYNLRSVQPEKIYPRDTSGKLALYDDIPKPLQGNVDITDAPFNRKAGDPPALTNLDIQDIIAFMRPSTRSTMPMTSGVRRRSPARRAEMTPDSAATNPPTTTWIIKMPSSGVNGAPLVMAA